MRTSVIVRAISIVFSLVVFSSHLKSQGANTCAGAISSPISMPNSFSNINTCSNSNSFNGNGACQFNFYYNANDRFFAFTATSSGFAQVEMTNINAPGSIMPSLSAFIGCPGTNACLSFNTISILSGNTANLSIIFPVILGETYVVLIDGYSNGTTLLDCFNFNIAFNYISIPTQPSCTNMGFESGDLSGWFASTGTSRQSTSGNTTPNYDISAIGEVNGRHTLFTGGVDPFGNFSRVAPGGGNYSIRLGNQFSSAEAEQLVQKFIVSSSNSSFTYNYAVVFQDPNHNSNEQPFFKAMLRDQNGQVIQCSEFIVSAAGNLPGFLSSPINPSVLYKPWSSVNVDLVDYIGQEVSVEFTTGDCSQGGHFGYAYIDCACAPSFLTTENDTICPGQSTVLQAPAGYASYSWAPGGFTTQNITVSPSITTNYILSATSFNGCVRNFTIPVVVNPNPVVSITANNANCNGSVTLTANASVAQGNISNLQWTVLGSPAGNQTVINPQFSGPGSFPVSVQATSNFGCQASISQAVVIPNCELTVNVSGGSICPGACFDLIASTTNANGTVTYSWSNGGPNNASWQVCPTNTTTYTVTATTSTGQTASAQVTVSVLPLPNINFTSTPISCLGAQNGSITATPSIAGTYQFMWSNGGTTQTIQNLSSGNYQVTVNDGTCNQTADFTLNPASALTFNATTTSASCGNNNGVITIQNVSNSISPYSISIDGVVNNTNVLPFSINNLSVGNHVVVVENGNGCSSTQNILINNLTAPQSFNSQTAAATCGQNNGCIQISNLVGGTAPFTYSLNGGNFQTAAQFCGLSAGSYNITVKDANDCSFTQSVTVNSTANLSVNITINQSPICPTDANGNLTAEITGGSAPYSVVWSNGATSNTIQNLTPGNYQVTVTDANGCSAVANSNLAYPPDFMVSYSETATICGLSNGAINLSVVGNTAPYQFSFDNSNWQNNEVFSALTAGNYNAWVKDANGCINTIPVVVSAIPYLTDFNLSSTPSTCGNANAEIQINNFVGITQNLSYSFDGLNWQSAISNGITLPNFSAGSYAVWVKDSNQCEVTKSVLVSNISGPTALISNTQSTTCGQNNGCINVSQVVGGVAPYSLLLGNQSIQLNIPFCQLSNQNYTIEVTDANGCVMNENITVGSISGLTVQANINQQVSCFGAQDGAAEITVSGGLAPYTVLWNDGSSSLIRNNLSAGIYTISVEDATQCVVSATLTITQPEALLAQLVSTATICGNANGSIQINNLSGGTLPYSYALNSVIGNDTQWNQLAAGSYQVQVSDANGCVWNGNSSILVTPHIQQFQASVQPSTCGLANGVINIENVQGVQNGLLISINQGDFESLNSFPYQFNDLLAGSYLVTIKDQNNCSVQQTQNVISLSAPSSIVVQAQPATCNLNNACLEIIQVIGGSAPYQYSFDGNSFSNIQQFCSLAAGDYNVAVKDANGCLFNQTFAVQTIAPPSVNVQWISDVVCHGENNGKAQAVVTNGQAPFVFQWTNGETTSLATNLSVGTHSVIVTDANQCQHQAQIDINEPDLLQATVSSLATTCGFANGEIEFQNVVGGISPYQFSILENPVQTSSLPEIISLATGNYQAVITDQNGCTWQQAIQVNSISYPVSVNSLAMDATCGLNNGQWLLSDVVGGVSPFTYQFQTNAWENLNSNQLAFTSLSQGQYQINIKDANGCLLQSSVQILQHIGPQSMQFTLTPATCDLDNAAIQLNNVVGGTAPYQYKLDNYAWTSIQNYNSLAGGSVVYQIKDANGCELDTNLVLEVIAPVDVNAILVRRVKCFGEQNGAAKAEIVAGTPPFQIQWLNGSTDVFQWNLGEGIATVVVTDAYQCVDSSTIYVPQPTPILVSISGINEFCLGGSSQLTVVSSGGGVHHNINWLHNNSYNPFQTVQPVVTTNYIATATDMLGCVGADTFTVVVHQPPTVDIHASLKVGCAPVCIEFTPIADLNQLVSFNWTFENGLTSQALEPKNCYNETGPVFAALAVKDIYGCINQVTYDTIAFVYPNPVAQFTPTENLVDVYAAQVTMINQSTPVPLYYWTFGDGNTSFDSNPTHIFADTGSYSVCLIAQSEFGCQGKVCQPIDVIAQPTYYIPSAFTPNDDGLNDIFNVQGTYLKSINMWIFNRWGEQIFYTDQLQSGWDGSYKGLILNPDVFVWKVQLISSFDEVIELNGKVAIVK